MGSRCSLEMLTTFSLSFRYTEHMPPWGWGQPGQLPTRDWYSPALKGHRIRTHSKKSLSQGDTGAGKGKAGPGSKAEVCGVEGMAGQGDQTSKRSICMKLT